MPLTERPTVIKDIFMHLTHTKSHASNDLRYERYYARRAANHALAPKNNTPLNPCCTRATLCRNNRVCNSADSMA
jgi:hypothetical protein